MPFKPLDTDEWLRFMRRVLIVGAPNAWKTTSLATWPRPSHILSYPGEHGAASIPKYDDIRASVWEEPSPPISAGAIFNQIVQETLDIISGKYGPTISFAGEGLHKLYAIIYDRELASLKEAFPNSDDDKLGGRAFYKAHEQLSRYLRKVNSSTVPYAVFTVWPGRDKDDPDDKRSEAPKHIWPDLPGNMARNIMGEFGLVLYAEPGIETAPGKFTAGTWQVRPQGRIWGAGTKLPPAIAAKIPTKVPQDWTALEALITRIMEEVK